MITLWHGLLANTAIVALVIALWSNVRLRVSDYSPRVRQIGFGILFGIGAIILMSLPFQLDEGVFIDLRSTMIAISFFVGGPMPGVITAVMAALFRLYWGGAGAPIGLFAISLTSLVSFLAYRSRKGTVPSLRESILLSAALPLVTIASSLLMPNSGFVVPHIQLPVVILVFVTTLMACLAVASELRRRQVEQTNHVYRMAIDSLPEPLNIKDEEGRFVIANPATATLLKAESAEALMGKTDFDYYPKEVAEAFRADELKVVESRVASVAEQQVHHLDGTTIWLSTLKAPLVCQEGGLFGVITHNRDVTDRRLLELALAERDRNAVEALSGMSDGMVMFDRHLNLVFCNERYRAMFSVTADLRVPGTAAASILYASIARGELVGIAQDQVGKWVETALSRLQQAGTVQSQLADGRWIESRTRPTPDGACFVICSDITDTKQKELELRDLNDRLSVLAETDGLTGLLNRRAFDALMGEEVARVEKGGGTLGLLMIDVDRFKAFNDTYGHGVGDTCLKAVASCLKATVRGSLDHAVRYGGEEMALVLPDADQETALAIANQFCESLRALKIEHSGSEKGIVTASVGVAIMTPAMPGMDANRLVTRADEALYVAKKEGRDTVRLWEQPKLRVVQ